MNFKRYKYDTDQLRDLYKALVYPRMIEEKMLKLLRQGQVSKWFSGIGQEAIAVGATMALQPDEYIMPLHRNLGVFTTRGISLEKLLLQWQGSEDGFTQGRDRSFHFGTHEFHIAGMISHLGAMLSVADGVALGNKLDGEHKVTLAFSGDGGTSEGEFHEALNLAAVWDLPVIFIVENNGYGLSTPSEDQFRAKSLADKGIGYGIESKTIDGNNVLEVYHQVNRIAKDLRVDPRPFLLECKTFRMRGHEEASGVKYVPPKLIARWEKKDPIMNYERYLIESGVMSENDVKAVRNELTGMIDEAVKVMRNGSSIIADKDKELRDVYLKHEPLVVEPVNETRKVRFIDSVQEGLYAAMKHYPELVLMGQDIAEYGGVFKITDGFVKEFGKERVRNTPISEAAPLGAALGLTIAGKKSMVEMQFADFVSCGFNQIVNNLAKTHYRWRQNSDVVIRMPTGAGAGAGPFHSQSNEAWFFHVPGMKIVYPSTPHDAKGLLLAAFDDPNPVLYFEHKFLYRNIEGDVPVNDYTIEIGKASFWSRGEDVTLISYGWGMHWCKEVLDELGVSATLLDLRTLTPWDKDAVKEAVADTGKVMIVHEDSLQGGIGAEISAWISEHCFEMLDAPVMRVASMDTPIPFNPVLEAQYLGRSLLKEKLGQLLAW